MSRLSVRLFGKLSVECDNQALDSLSAAKVQELFCYLLLHRDREHPRETIAGLLWGDNPTAQSRKYLRQALWRLQIALRCQLEPVHTRVLVIQADSVRLTSAASLWLDVAVFEQTFATARGVPSGRLDATGVQALQTAADLYQGDLLEGWYQDWCLHERERLQNMYLAILEKLMGYCEAHHEYEAGLTYGTRILRYDRAHECAHQRLMRLHYLAGDRAGALRQYERCAAALEEELGVKPSEPTVALHDQIRAGRVENPNGRPSEPQAPLEAAAPLPEVLGRLKEIRTALTDIQRQVRQDIETVERALKSQR